MGLKYYYEATNADELFVIMPVHI